MKKLLFFFVSLLLAHTAFSQCNSAFTKSISGYVVTFTNTSTFTQNTNSIVTFNMDFGDGSTTTNFFPSFTINHTYAASGTYIATLKIQQYDSLTNSISCADSTSQTIVITGGSSSNNYIMGNLFIDTINNPTLNAVYKVWLIKYDSLAQTLYATDSLIDSAVSAFTIYQFNNVPTGNYFVKAAVINGPTSGTGPVPTYGFSSLYWSSATMVNHIANNTDYQNIILQQGTVTSGPGFVGGSISAGANKGTKVTGVPVPNMLVFLEDNATGNVIKYAYTDANGDYSFSNLATGTYKVYPEEMGYQTTAWANVTVTASQTTADQVNFKEHTLSKTITPDNVGVTSIANVNGQVVIFPNPTNGQLFISSPEAAHISVTDMVGHILLNNDVKQGNNSFNISALSSGIYLINVKGDHVNFTSKVTLQH